MSEEPEAAPRRLDCAQACTIPDGVDLVEMPRARHACGDVLNCPNDGCGRSFMVKEQPSAAP